MSAPAVEALARTEVGRDAGHVVDARAMALRYSGPGCLYIEPTRCGVWCAACGAEVLDGTALCCAFARAQGRRDEHTLLRALVNVADVVAALLARITDESRAIHLALEAYRAKGESFENLAVMMIDCGHGSVTSSLAAEVGSRPVLTIRPREVVRAKVATTSEAAALLLRRLPPPGSCWTWICEGRLELVAALHNVGVRS